MNSPLEKTNIKYCPQLREDGTSRPPEEIKSGYEIVINGISREAIEAAMRAGIKAACTVPGVVKITAANFEGKLGPHQFHLRKILG